MATQRLVNTNFWRDSYVIGLDPAEKLLFLYFLTNPATTLAGVYEIDLRLVALDTGFDQSQITNMLGRFCKDGKMHYERGWLVLRNFVKHQRLNPSVKIGIERAIAELPQWLQDKISLEADDNKQISLLEPEIEQSGDSLGTSSIQTATPNLTKLNSTKRNGTQRPIGRRHKNSGGTKSQSERTAAVGGNGYKSAVAVASVLKQKSKGAKK